MTDKNPYNPESSFENAGRYAIWEEGYKAGKQLALEKQGQAYTYRQVKD